MKSLEEIYLSIKDGDNITTPRVGDIIDDSIYSHRIEVIVYAPNLRDWFITFDKESVHRKWIKLGDPYLRNGLVFTILRDGKQIYPKIEEDDSKTSQSVLTNYIKTICKTTEFNAVVLAQEISNLIDDKIKEAK